MEKRRLTNREFSQKDEGFKSACSAVGIEPTTRQASKWRSRRGRAFVEGRDKASEFKE